MRLRIGLVGQGKDWTHRYQPSLRLMQDRFDIRFVYHAVAALAESIAREFRAQRVDGFREMIARSELDAIFFLESDWYGIAPIVAACESGKSVFCGTDVDFDPLQVQEIKSLVDHSGISFMAELSRRFAPATIRLKELIATKLGHPTLLFCHRRVSQESKHSNRCCRPMSAIADRELVELIDWCRYLVGSDPLWIQAIGHPSTQPNEPNDYQICSLGFGDQSRGPGILAQISCGMYIPTAWPEAITFRPPAAIQVCCERGIAFVDMPSSLVWFDAAGRHQETLDQELSIGQQQFTQFHRSITSLVRQTAGLDDFCEALRYLQAAKRSMSEGCRIPL